MAQLNITLNQGNLLEVRRWRTLDSSFKSDSGQTWMHSHPLHNWCLGKNILHTN